MTSPADRIAWLAALSAQRRAYREYFRCSSDVAIAWQTAVSNNLPRRYRGLGFEFTPRPPKPLPVAAHAVPHMSVKRFSRIVKAQGGRCYLCDRAMSAPTREHVVPKALGVRNARNVLAAHQRCNVAKASRPPRPCEMLYLDAVYLRLLAPSSP